MNDSWFFLCTNLNSFHPMMPCAKLYWNLHSSFGKIHETSLLYFTLFYDFLQLEKPVILYENKKKILEMNAEKEHFKTTTTEEFLWSIVPAELRIEYNIFVESFYDKFWLKFLFNPKVWAICFRKSKLRCLYSTKAKQKKVNRDRFIKVNLI